MQRIAPRVSLSGGYSFIWFNKVATAGDAINPVINTNPFPPPANPTFAFKDNDFWIMGGNYDNYFKTGRYLTYQARSNNDLLLSVCRALPGFVRSRRSSM